MHSSSVSFHDFAVVSVDESVYRCSASGPLFCSRYRHQMEGSVSRNTDFCHRVWRNVFEVLTVLKFKCCEAWVWVHLFSPSSLELLK